MYILVFVEYLDHVSEYCEFVQRNWTAFFKWVRPVSTDSWRLNLILLLQCYLGH